jgi:carbon storage regulator
MLILSRKAGEEIILGNDIVIKVTEISKGSVKIGIEAPKETTILRGELRDKIEASNREAARNVDTETLQKLSLKLQR